MSQEQKSAGFIQTNARRGYILVPAGITFITRRCCILAEGANEKIYSYYLPSSKKKRARQKGIYVLKSIFKEAESDYYERKAIEEKKWLQKLDKVYPNMPSKDRREICRLFPSQFPKSVVHRDITILHYVQDRYTALKKDLSHDKLSAVAAAKARQKADKILSVWRGKD